MALTGVPFVLQMDKNFLAKLAVSKPDEQVHALMAFDWEGISLLFFIDDLLLIERTMDC